MTPSNKYTKSITKQDAIAHWRKMRKRVNPLPLMNAIPYKASGSKYGACGIRIDGTPEFIDAVLSNLTELLDGESIHTRLELARRKVDSVTVGDKTKHFENADDNSEVCYIRLHTRGHEGKIAAAIFGTV